MYKDNEQFNEIRHAVNWRYFGAGSRVDEKAQQWANEIIDLIKHHSSDNLRLAVKPSTQHRRLNPSFP